MRTIFQQDQIKLDAERITSYKHPVFGDTTVFHGVVIASEMVQPYEDGRAYKSRDELEKYAPYVDGRWVIVGAHPVEGIISERDQVSGRTINPHYVKDLNDPKTKRPCRAGVRADIEIFDGKVSPQTLLDMKNGKKQDVSIGFFFSKDETPGIVEVDACKGEEYDYVQRNMFHDHLAAGLDNGRCPMPYCGLGADEIIKNLTGDPFAGFENFNDCINKVMEKNPKLSKESAIKICGKLKAQHEDVLSANTRQNLKALAAAIIDECNREDAEYLSTEGDKSIKDIIVQSVNKQIDEKMRDFLKDVNTQFKLEPIKEADIKEQKDIDMEYKRERLEFIKALKKRVSE